VASDRTAGTSAPHEADVRTTVRCVLLAAVAALSAGCGSDDAAAADAAAGDGDGRPADAAPGDADVAGPDAVPATPAIYFVGRHDDSNPDAVRFGWPGTGVVVRFAGTGIRVRMNDPAQYYSLVIDGVEQPRLATTSGERLYDLASGLADDVHAVELYRRTEGFFGPTVFLGAELDGTLLAPTPPTRRIEILGDSITCGYGNEGADQYCNFSADTENHYLTYGAIAAREVGAELSTIAWSGKGVIYNYGDDTVEPLPELYDRTVPTDGSVTWDFVWQPDVVVVNLGTNDFSTDNDPTETLFVGAYVALLEQIRAAYPDAVVLCTVAPLLGGSDQTTVEGYIDEAIAERAVAGDSGVSRIDLSVAADGWGCDWHPSVATHQAMAARLVSVLHDELGW